AAIRWCRSQPRSSSVCGSAIGVGLEERNDSMEKTTNHPPSIREAGDQLRDDITHLRDAVVQTERQLVEQATRWVEKHPLGAVGAAFGVGYLLSGALVSRSTAKAVGIGGRILFGWLARQALAGAIPGLLDE